MLVSWTLVTSVFNILVVNKNRWISYVCRKFFENYLGSKTWPCCIQNGAVSDRDQTREQCIFLAFCPEPSSSFENSIIIRIRMICHQSDSIIFDLTYSYKKPNLPFRQRLFTFELSLCIIWHFVRVVYLLVNFLSKFIHLMQKKIASLVNCRP